MNYLLSVGIQLLKASPQPSPGLIVTGEEPKLGHLARALHHQARREAYVERHLVP